MSFLKNYFLYFILIITLALSGYVYTIQADPCEDPLTYSMGSFDARFGITEEEFSEAVAEASYIWENSLGKDLFVLEDEEKSQGVVKDFLEKYIDKYFVRQEITVNLVYDERQELANKNRELSSQVNQTQQSADVIKREFSVLQQEHKKVEAEYQAMLVQYKNRKIDRQTVENKRLEVNLLVDEINALIKKYNFLVKEANVTIGTLNQTAGHEFEEGIYISDKNGERIEIYEFGSRTVLVRVLAHELGHALGLEHNDNPDSIMYYLNNSKNLMPTEEDLGELRAICKGK